MNDRRYLAPLSLAFVAGMVLWFIAAAISGEREAWDSAAYWVLAYPLALLCCTYLGYAYPERPWRWALVLFEAQFVAMCIRNGELGGLWPLGMALFAVLAAPGIFLARLGARIRDRPTSERG